MKCKRCGKEAQKIKCLGGMARRFDPRRYCKKCYDEIKSANWN